MSDRSKRLQSSVILFALILLIFLATAIGLSFLPQDLSDLEGRTENGQADGTSRNLERVLENAANQNIAVRLTEEEINQWIAQKVAGSQTGPLTNNVLYRGAWVRLKDDSLDLIFERTAFGRPHTVAMNITIEQTLEGNNRVNSQIKPQGGRLGQMPVPQGYLLLVMNSYHKLAAALSPETKALHTILTSGSTISLTDGTVTFQPRDEVSLDNF
ncbi:MAG: hypothetical protein AAGC74_07995 [Verrucomicrobiota bacterium]